MTSTPNALVIGTYGNRDGAGQRASLLLASSFKAVAFRELEEKKSPTGSSIYDSYRKDLPGKICPLLESGLSVMGMTQ